MTQSGRWFDGGYTDNENVTTVDGNQYTLLTSLGTLGWIARRHETGRKVILLFSKTLPAPRSQGEDPP